MSVYLLQISDSSEKIGARTFRQALLCGCSAPALDLECWDSTPVIHGKTYKENLESFWMLQTS